MTVGISEAKQKLSELVERAAQGEEIVITCRGRKRVRIVGAVAKGQLGLPEIFASFSRIRIKLPHGESVKALIEEGRRF